MGIFKDTIQNNTDIDDEVLANSMISAATAAANAYLNATTTSSTPELRSMFASSLSQIVGGQAAITELAINKGWENPYDTPSQQLSDVYTKSERTVGKDDKALV